MTVRGAVGALASRVWPGLEEFVYNRNRNRAFPDSFRRSPRDQIQLSEPRPPHIVVVPLEGPSTPDWGPARGNYFYEVHRTAVERFGEDAVSVVDVALSGGLPWPDAVADHLKASGATHMIAHLERDPGSADDWNWDRAWSAIANSWDGVFIGVTFDSGFPLIRMKARRLARISPSFVCLDICVPMDGRLVKGRTEVGPVPLVQSRQTQELLLARIQGEPKDIDVSFIGALYPYRVELVETLRGNGVNVVVNPHRQEATTDLASSRTNQPSWLDYMAGLARSQMTLNFSLASSGRDQQLKWRVMEATLAGSLLLTDDHVRTAEFFSRGEEFDEFSSPDDLVEVVERWLAQSDRLATAQHHAQVKALELAQSEFWNRIDRTLQVRGLPDLPSTVKLDDGTPTERAR